MSAHYSRFSARHYGFLFFLLCGERRFITLLVDFAEVFLLSQFTENGPFPIVDLVEIPVMLWLSHEIIAPAMVPTQGGHSQSELILPCAPVPTF
jgi:hypothetical protein